MRRAVLLVAGTLLAGCNSSLPDVDFLLHDPAVAESAPANAKAPAGENGADVVNEGPDAVRKAHANLPVPPPKRKPAKVMGIQPEKLVGMTRDEVKALIGVPVTVADKPPATVWSYRTTACALEIFFYLDVGSKTFRALTYQVRNEGEASIPATDCLGQIRAVSYGS